MDMSEQINPYLVFLELETAPKKPTYYELLAVEQHEQDESVISKGCEQALAKVRSFKPGSNARIWLAILDELALAKNTLIDPEERLQYDQKLANGTLPGELEYVVLEGPLEIVESLSVSVADNSQALPEQPSSLADQLVPSHLMVGSESIPTVAGSTVTPVAAPVSMTPAVPVAAEVAMPIGHSTESYGMTEVEVTKAEDNVSTATGFSLENPRNSPGSRRSRRLNRHRSKSSSFPASLVIASVFILLGAVVGIVALNSGNNEVASRDKTDSENRSKGSRVPAIGPKENGNQETKPNQQDTEVEKPMARDPETGGNPLKPLPTEFGDSTPGQGKNEPDEPETTEVKPVPESSEPEEPEPEPLTPQEKAKLKEALSTARVALAERNLDIVSEQLAVASPLARTKEAALATSRLKLMVELVTQFNRLANQAMDSYQSGSEINVGSSTKAVVVEVSPAELTIKVAGVVRNYPRNKLSVGLAMGIAETNFDDPVMTPFMKAAYLVTLKGDRYEKQAREFWQSGNSGSAKVDANAFDAFVADTYEFK